MDEPRLLDLDDESRAALELDAVMDAVAIHAVTPMGAAAIRALRPVADRGFIVREHAAVLEVVRHLTENGRCLSARLEDPTVLLERLTPEGGRLDATELRNLAAVLSTSDELAERLEALPSRDFPYLHEIGAALPIWGADARQVVDSIAPDGRVLDHASAELGRIRSRIGRVGERLRGMLERMVRGPDAESFIQDEFITQRNGRFVVPVRSDSARPVGGIVHASSSSGATLFVEPLASVELNNELVRLGEGEQEETRRILDAWADRFRARLAEVDAALTSVARVDSLQARAIYAQVADARPPGFEDGQGLELRDVRHPLLDRTLREQGKRCVPITLGLDAEHRVLVLSGPNTGGKTVALKTLALAVLMAQSGLPVSAAKARLPLFVQLRADIGDHQSIEANLSTFSAHVEAVAGFLREASPPALFLFDEIGTGTEPTEGAALARAILERLLREKVITVATTHQAALKAWACTTPGAVSAAMEFDVVALRPTYRVLPGVAGVSAGLDIASRFRMPETVVERARELLGSDNRQTESFLNRIQDQLRELERERSELQARRSELEQEHDTRSARQQRELERERRAAELALDRAVEEVTALGLKEVGRIRDGIERRRAERARVKGETRVRSEATRRKAALAPSTPTVSRPLRAEQVQVGARVAVPSLGRDGEVVAVGARTVKVALGSATFTVDRGDLYPASGPPPVPLGSTGRTRPLSRDDDDVPSEIVLVGRTVDEAMPDLDKCLDRAALAGRSEVRIVHGHGTGRLRSAVRRFLAGHPLIESHRPDSGDAATIARLK